MKIGCSLDLVDLRYQEPNRNKRESQYYWEELYKMISAAGFKGIELPYEPYWDFGGRTGIPFTLYTVKAAYGSVKKYVEFLNNSGIEEIASIHFNPTMFIGKDLDRYFGAFMHFAVQAVEFAAQAGTKTVIVTPTPDIGELQLNVSVGQGEWPVWVEDFLKRTNETLAKLGEIASKSGVKLAIKNEFWSLAHGGRIDDFLKVLEPGLVGYSADTAHLSIGRTNPADIIKKYKDRLDCVQFCDTAFEDVEDYYKKFNPEYPATGTQKVFCDMGQGKVDLPGIYNTLKECGYNGWVICSCRQTADVMRALLRMRYHLDNVILKA
ncbi:sugar phosphate isomerase/epimerase [Anaerobacterium chartisolvens]|uniref:Sugar phosphate isomerase/epimerase n=1 Tax=Anaerobacterium chartisolvens TaxID=1297424 RepID=A0A369B374_9FIRM|nr:sugar phosphate isomerase/epimerase [Anaerobacterium chartisolvens]RCX16050.1 sugar phosphate isomerase/epimerase [Anaerobacterium chartisolvens]